MNENIDLTKILEGCPKGTKFYSILQGEVSFINIDILAEHPIVVSVHNKYTDTTIYDFYVKDGRYNSFYDGECTLFPSKEQRDWSKFKRFWDKPKIKKFDVNTLQPFDKVLSRYGTESNWMCTYFSHIIDKINPYVDCNGIIVHVCIPYNEDTKHLVGTNKDCPEFYKWWEEE